MFGTEIIKLNVLIYILAYSMQQLHIFLRFIKIFNLLIVVSARFEFSFVKFIMGQHGTYDRRESRRERTRDEN